MGYFLDPTTMRSNLGAARLDDDDFVINDIPLKIPPSSITINKRNMLNEWATLRSATPTRTKSGHANISITIEVIFQGNAVINDHLRPLVAGLWSTPFCSVNNKYLHNQLKTLAEPSDILSDYKQLRPVTLVLGSMSFSTIPGKPDCIYAQLNFTWFNYLPYSSIWAYKTGDNFNIPGPAWKSVLWEKFYEPFLLPMQKINWPHSDQSKNIFSFHYNEFAMVPSGNPSTLSAGKELINIMKNKPEEFFSALGGIINSNNTVHADEALDRIFQKLTDKGLVDKQVIDALQGKKISSENASIIYPLLKKLYPLINTGAQTASKMVNKNQGTIEAAVREIDNQINKVREVESMNSAFENWEEITSLAAKADVMDDLGVKKNIGGFKLFKKKNKLNLSSQVVEQLSISFTPNIAIIPMIGYTYPTCQFTGGYSIDLSMSINATHQAASAIQASYEKWNETARKFRQVPQGFTTVAIECDFVQLFGIKEFLATEINNQTIEGQPGRCQLALSFAYSGINSQTKFNDPEELIQEYVSTSKDLKEEIWKVLSKYLQHEENNFYIKSVVPDGEGRNKALSDLVNEMKDIFNDWTDTVMDEIFAARTIGVINGDSGQDAYNVFVKPILGSEWGFLPGYKWLRDNVEWRKRTGEDRNQKYLGLKTKFENNVLSQEEYKRRIQAYNFQEYLTQTSDNSKGLSKKQEIAKLKSRINELERTLRNARQGEKEGLFGYKEIGNNPEYDGIRKELKDAQKRLKVLEATHSLDKEELEKNKSIEANELGLYEYQKKVNELFEKINQYYLDIPEFRHLEQLKNRGGLGKGRTAYPDFKLGLSNIGAFLDAGFTDANLIDYDPDFFMWSPAYDGATASSLIGSIIDPYILAKAKTHSMNLYDRAQGSMSDFFQGTYRELLKDPDYELPYKALEKYSEGKLAPELYKGMNYKNSTLNEGEANGGIKKTVFNDPNKISTNWYGSKIDEKIKGRGQVDHTTDFGLMWQGIETGPTQSSQSSGNQKDHYVSSTAISSSSSGSSLGVNGIEVKWGLKQKSVQSPNSKGLVCPVKNYKRRNPAVEVRHVGSTKDKNFWDASRRKCVVSDWNMSSEDTPLRSSGLWYNPNEAPNHPAIKGKSYYKKPVSTWTLSNYEEWSQLTGKKMGYIHKGIDVFDDIGTDIYAVADGIIQRITPSPQVVAGLFIEIRHPDNTSIPFSRYLHLEQINPKVKAGIHVKAGDCIAVMGQTGQPAGERGMSPHLHFETWDKPFKGANRTGCHLKNPDTIGIPWIPGSNAGRQSPTAAGKKKLQELANTRTISNNITSLVSSPLREAINDFETRLIKGQSQRLCRAYPTFKLYFIEDDSGERKRLAFDDFFSYNAVNSIRVIKSRKIPADLCVLELTNISGTLTNRKFRNSSHPGDPRTSDGKKAKESLNPAEAGTLRENPMASLLLQEGIDIHLKMGYCVDEKTEILTKRGWLKHNELSLDDTILTLNHVSSQSEWQKINNINKYNYINQDMIKISGLLHSSLTTLNHKWPVLQKRKDYSAKQYYMKRGWKTSDTLKSSDYLILGAPNADIPIKTTYNDDFVRLIGWFWTEGRINNNKPNHNPNIVISQSIKNEKFIRDIRTILTNLYGLPVDNIKASTRGMTNGKKLWTERKRANREEVCFRLNTQLSFDLLSIAPNRIISTSFIEKLTKKQLELLLLTSNNGDGGHSHVNKPPYTIAQKNPKMLEAIELAAILLGYKTHLYTLNHRRVDRKGKIYYMTSLYISPQNTMSTYDLSVRPHIVKYSGVAWCPTVKNNTWLARRNGHIYFTGNSADPSLLDPVFTGKIVSVIPNETDDLLTIIAQSHASELVSDIKGIDKPSVKSNAVIDFGFDFTWGFGDWATTGRIMEEYLAEPEIIHFGRWERGNLTQNRDLLVSRFNFTPNVYDDNIFAPPMYEDIRELGHGRLIKDISYIVYRTTVWDIFKEMELRHPNFIGSPVPYTDRTGERMTYFFGLPNQMYFARDPNPDEQDVQEKLKKEGEAAEKELPDLKTKINKLRNQLAYQKAPSMNKNGYYAGTDPKYDDLRYQLLQAEHRLQILETIKSADDFKQKRLAIAKQAGYIKPFRQYHLLTSANHIIANNIVADARDVANTIAIKYPDKWFGRSASSGDIDNNSPTGQTQLANGVDEQVFTLKLDNALPTEDIKTQIGQFVNVTWDGLAKRYALSLLCRNLKDTYKGSLIIIGDASIKPLDATFIFDEYTDMIGAVEVEQVVHSFTRENGFVTEITPDMCVYASEWSLLASAEALGIVMEGLINKWTGKTGANLFLNNSMSPFAYMMGYSLDLFGCFMSQKIINFTQLGQPLVMAPLRLHSREYTAGIPTRKIPTSLWDTVFGKWKPQSDKAYSAWWEDWTDRLGTSVKSLAGIWGGGYSVGKMFSE